MEGRSNDASPKEGFPPTQHQQRTRRPLLPLPRQGACQDHLTKLGKVLNSVDKAVLGVFIMTAMAAMGVQIASSKTIQKFTVRTSKFALFGGSFSVLLVSMIALYMKKYYPDQMKMAGEEENDLEIAPGGPAIKEILSNIK